MHPIHQKRIAFALKCKPEEVSMDDETLQVAFDKRLVELRARKIKKVVDYGESIH